MKTVVISGYYGYENTGDEALLASIIKALKLQMPDVHIIVLSISPEETAICYGVQSVNRLSFFQVISALKSADLLISGGGSLLQDVTGSLTIPYYLGIVALAKMMGKPVMFYAQGIGPVNGRIGRLLIRLIGSRADMITLRDKASACLLQEIGVRRPPVEVTADPVFALEPETGTVREEVFRTLGIPAPAGPVVGIFIREWQGTKGYKEAVAKFADTMLAKERQVIFIPMQYPADVAPAREIAAMMGYAPVLAEKALGFSRIAELVKSMDIVVGMRLHALIIAACFAVPMVGLSYDPKVSDFLRGIGQPVLEDLENISAAQLVEEVEKVLDNRDIVRKGLLDIRKELQQKALRNSEIAAQLID
ncbi:polysaccharide pyruvyl transferase CsaB [Phosphitispora sp. TUW77]|uniref:polysaccharide pyruvyl transferase CsaB n=1 Tax=Phosphitispora sp. TUW77 TaxID=3152361 RepID=UPI003AB69F5A